MKKPGLSADLSSAKMQPIKPPPRAWNSQGGLQWIEKVPSVHLASPGCHGAFQARWHGGPGVWGCFSQQSHQHRLTPVWDYEAGNPFSPMLARHEKFIENCLPLSEYASSIDANLSWQSTHSDELAGRIMWDNIGLRRH
jgi:hypothetical protein